MIASKDQVFQGHLELSEQDRVELIELLKESLEHKPRSELDRLWLEECRRRWQEVESGDVEALDGDAVFHELEKEFGT
jgi:putative addiction module component (TIGR02574 family)